jgi:hypothetical protein
VRLVSRSVTHTAFFSLSLPFPHLSCLGDRIVHAWLSRSVSSTYSRVGRRPSSYEISPACFSLLFPFPLSFHLFTVSLHLLPLFVSFFLSYLASFSLSAVVGGIAVLNNNTPSVSPKRSRETRAGTVACALFFFFFSVFACC